MKRILIGICIVVFILCMGCGWARVLQFPAGLTAIEAQAFMGDSALKEIILPEGIQSIGSQAFADSGIKIVRGKDASEIEIAPDAFGEGCAFFLPSYLIIVL